MITQSKNKNLTILSEAEQSALYDIPEYNNEQRLEYLSLTDTELNIALNRHNISAQIYCILQFGYFKAVKLFFRITWEESFSDDISFILQQYFENKIVILETISKHEHYAQCTEISKLYEYKPWTKDFENTLYSHAEKIICRDMNQKFITMEILDYLQTQKIIRPRYTTLQVIVSSIINNEYNRIFGIINSSLTNEEITLLKSLVIDEDTLSKLAALKQDAKDFKPQMMIAERNKLETLRPIYKTIKRLMQSLKLSQQNLHYYAELANYYTIHELRTRLKTELAYLYLLCYCWKRFRQVSDNLVAAFSFFLKQIEDEIDELSNLKLTEHVMGQREELIKMKQLAQLYVDDEILDATNFGVVRGKAFEIIPRNELVNKVSTKKSIPDADFYWQAVDKHKRRVTLNLRHLVAALGFSSINPEDQWLGALSWIKTCFSKLHKITALVDDCPDKTIPIKLLPYLTFKTTDQPAMVNLSRYELWVYRQINNKLKNGSIFLEDSLQHRSLNQELVPIEKMDEYTQQLNLPKLTQPINSQLDELFTELNQLWSKFNKDLKKRKLKHLRYDEKTKTIHWHKIKVKKDEQALTQFYKQMPLCDITDVLRYVNRTCGFLSAFTHVQPRYSKQPAKIDHLIGTIIAQAMNNGNLNMSDISDIPYALLQDTLQSRIRLSTLKQANDLISNDIAKMPIFPFYSIDINELYGGVDGQKFEAETPTIKTRYSKKYFRKGKGIVAYTLLSNHVPLQVDLIGANDHESYFAFDIWYNNTCDINPTILTGDMHIINRANFVTMYLFGGKLYPRFTNIEAQRSHLFSETDNPEYEKYLIKPAGQINRQLIESEWANLQRIIVTLGMKEMTQSTLIKKLCTYKQESRTRMALYEFDKLIRSIHTLKYLLDPTIQSNTHRSQNRVEQYHQLRGSIAQAYGKKQLIGRTDLALEISNQCGRLIANAIIHYNSSILSKLLEKYEAEGNQKALNLLKKISPIAWQHIHFQGHFKFSEEHIIDLDEIIAKLTLGT
ncbi:MAG: Tn3 family transposase [Burkholderiales bacterium]|nr:Tn3 family transposase [Burkholderiales bacterium]